MDVRSALITGASSGIGAALAEALARPGVMLHLSGRNASRLDAIAVACRARGATVATAVLDVCEREAMAAWIGGAGRLDLVVANAGASAGTAIGAPESPEIAPVIFATNLDGVVHTVLPALAVMAEQPAGADGVRGRIVAIASIAAFAVTPWSPAYGASKAAVDAWIVGSAPEERRRGVVLTSVCPGYVRTAMTAGNRFPMPGLMDADRAARIILRGVAAGRSRVVFPWWMGLLARVAGLLPAGLMAAAAGRRAGQG
jgi:short-subunit dehydrogenase